MFYLIVSVHFLLCIILVGLVLVQQGKGAEMGAAFGAGGSNTLFGAAGAAPTIIKLTTGVCVLFMITSILLIRTYGDYASRAAPLDALQGSVFDAAPVDGAVVDGAAVEGAVESGGTTSAVVDGAEQVEASPAGSAVAPEVVAPEIPADSSAAGGTASTEPSAEPVANP
jgi:preprotein translocase subunit SecG